MDELFRFKKDINDNKDSLFINNPKSIQKLELSSLYGVTAVKTELPKVKKEGNFYNSEFKVLISESKFDFSDYDQNQKYLFSLKTDGGEYVISKSPNVLINTRELNNKNNVTVTILIFLKLYDILDCIRNNNYKFNRIDILRKINYFNYNVLYNVLRYDLHSTVDMTSHSSIIQYFRKVSKDWYAIKIQPFKDDLCKFKL